MNSVSRVKALCKERKIPICKLEKDLGYANGYIGQLKKGTFPDERLFEIAKYLGVSTEYLLTGENKKTPSAEAEDEITMKLKEFALSATPDELRQLEFAIEFIKSKRK